MTSDTSKQLQQALRDIDSNSHYTFLTAKQEFDNSSFQLSNPDLIDEELTRQKSVFSKLKFLYLEQETRDKFLRKISELNALVLDDEEVQQMQQLTIIGKQNLKQLKQQMSQRFIELGDLTQQTNELYSLYTAKLNETSELIDEIAQMEAEIDDSLQQSQHKQILEMVAANDSIDIGSSINSKELDLSKEKSELELTQTQVSLHEQQNVDQQRIIDDLQDSLVTLQSKLSTAPANMDDESQLFAKWCHDTNEILLNFTNLTNLQIKRLQDGSYKYTIYWGKDNSVGLVVDKQFNVQHVTGTHEPIQTGTITDESSFIEWLVRFIRSKAV